MASWMSTLGCALSLAFCALAQAAPLGSPTKPSFGPPSTPAAFAQGHIIVKYKSKARSLSPLGRAIGSNSRLRAVPLAEGVSVESALQEFRSDPDVEYAAPDHYIYPDAIIPTDPLYKDQWFFEKVKAPAAWNISTGGDVTVCIIDSGVDYKHPDLAPNMHPLIGWNAIQNNNDPSDELTHGTHVAGLIGAATNNARDVAGMNWKVKLLACKFMDGNGYGQYQHALACIDYCVRTGSKVISASWTGINDPILLQAISDAGRRGVLFVGSAGNKAQDLEVTPSYPQSFRLANQIVVASSGDQDLLSSYSNYGASTVHLAAPGEWILSTIPTANATLQNGVLSPTATMFGTSMATPIVSGAAALVLAAAGGDLKVNLLKQLLLDSVDRVPALQGKLVSGGRLNVEAALQLYLQRRVVKAVPKACQPYPAALCDLQCDKLMVCRYVKKKRRAGAKPSSKPAFRRTLRGGLE